MSSGSVSSSPPDVDYGPFIIRVLTPMTILVTVVVCLRIAIRIRRVASIGIDDWLMIISLVLSWGFYTSIILLINLGGVGKPTAAGSPRRILYDAKFVFAGQLIYATSILSTKLSILAMYRQIFPVRLMKLGRLVLSYLTVIWWGVYVLFETFQCKPIKKVFNPAIEGHCIGSYEFILGLMVPNIVTDVAILCLPIYEIVNLHLTPSQRITLSGIFLFGSCVIVASGIRLRYHIQLSQVADIDTTLAYVNPILWTALEPDLGIICGCLPVLGPLFNGLVGMRPFIWIRKFTRCSRNYDGNEARSMPVSLRALRTIGGSTMHRDDVGKGRKSQDPRPPINSMRRFQKLDDDDSDCAIKVSCYGNERDVRRELPDLWPRGYAAGYRTVVRKTSDVEGNKVPLGAIAVETVVDWEESGPASDTT
ncbi:uncharacterized protein F4812DRAFT_425425 [Daldinia caldariorum]|uniref:uncharacterized protein n=1 Tax=Daldinia caldariorum TaxID=326644 RepID=UPI002007DDAD|nr:uncharacterized protein F4812DRAFT_425425 [Daldinia caldariorum]KAI1469005.1 hypothetical protein F4812DRAFT_425425 [Daldinia caldariorum]